MIFLSVPASVLEVKNLQELLTLEPQLATSAQAALLVQLGEEGTTALLPLQQWPN